MSNESEKTDLSDQDFLDISISKQTLSVFQAGQCINKFCVSTAKNGAGEQKGSGCTPRGWHKIRAKIGQGALINTVFVGRRPTGEIYSPELEKLHSKRDWILTRILWLSGIEPYKNRYGSVDTCWRYIYIHGTNEESIIGQPASHGCIRMKNADLLVLFDQVKVGHKVYIH
jgi:lipoprotein-anchoring transpeptidase ErfK/SrfK